MTRRPSSSTRLSHAAPRRERGFTLVEALVALAILGLIAVLAYRATASLTGGESRLARESARWRTLDLVFNRLEADLRQAVPRTSRHGDAREAAWSVQPEGDAGNSALVFSRAGPEFSSEPGQAGQRVGYRVRDGTLEALFWPQLDNVADRGPQSYALFADVAAFRVRALSADGQWLDRWPLRAGDGLPRAVQVELALRDGTRIERLYALR